MAEIGLVYPKLRTVDNKVIFVPNGEIATEKIINYNGQDKRRVDLTFTVSYDAVPEVVKSIMQEVVGAHDGVTWVPMSPQKLRRRGYNQSELLAKAVAKELGLPAWDLLEQVRAAFERAGVELTYNHLNVHIIPPNPPSSKGESD